MFDFFVSHATADKNDIVDSLVFELKKRNITVWYDKDIICYGNDINKEIDYGLKHSICLILIVTKHFFDSKWVFFEFGRYSTYEKARIIPVIYDISSEQYLQIIQILGNIKYIDTKSKSLIDTVQLLVDNLHRIKENNEDLTIKDQIYKLHKAIESKEDINSGLVSMSISEFIEVSDSYPSHTVFCARKVALEILRDIGKVLDVTFDSSQSTRDFDFYLETYKNKLNKNIFEYFRFIFNSDLYSMDESYLKLINKALLYVLQWYFSLKYQTPSRIYSFELIMPGEMKHENFLETDEIDYLVLREDLIASVDTAIEWYDYNYYTYLAIRDQETQKIAGYITVLPITEDTYYQILSGDFMDKEFTADSILQYDFPGLYTVYVASIAVHPQYQNSNAFFELYNATIDLFLELAKEREVYINRMIAEASTKQGEKLCKMLRMKKYCSTTSSTDVYTLTLIPPEFKLIGTKGKDFMNLYKQKYEEYKEYFDEF